MVKTIYLQSVTDKFMRLPGVITSQIVSLLILFIVFVNSSYASEENTKIRVGIYQNYPLVSQNINGVPQGLFVDILNEIASQEGWEPNFFFDTFSNCLKRLENDELDLLSAVAQTEQRDQFLDFSKETVCTLWGIVYVQPNSEIQTILELDGKVIAIMSKGIFGHTFKKLCADFNIKPYFVETKSQSDSLELLKAKKVDAATFNNAFKEVYDEPDISRTSITYSPMKISFASKEGDGQELLRVIDSALSKWKENEHSFYYQALQRWLGAIEVPKKYIPMWLIYAIVGLGIIIIVSLYWVTTLKKQIKKRKIAEEALQDSENRFHSLSDASFEGIVITEKGNIFDANNTLAKMLGYPTAELVGMKAFDLVIPEKRDEAKSRMLSGSEKTYESICLRKDGSNFPIEIHAKMFSYQGRQVRVTAIRDLTEQKKAEEEIKTLRSILPICSSCKRIRDDKGYWNQIEGYIQKHTEASFSHGICPECSDELYGNEAWYIKMENDQ